VDYRNLVTGEQLLRAVGPEAIVTLDGADYRVGGLSGELPAQNYLRRKWVDELRASPEDYAFVEWKEAPMSARFAWKKHLEWLSKMLPWPAPGKVVSLRFAPPAQMASQMAGRAVFAEGFGAHLDPSWKMHVSASHPRSSFSNEGKNGEIYTPAESAVYVERPWPSGAVNVEATVDVGDDTVSNAWGPGIALVAPDRALSFCARPNQLCFDVNGDPKPVTFDRAKPVRLRIRLDGKEARCEGAQEGGAFKLIATMPFPKPPTALRVGKIGRGGLGQDNVSAGVDPLVRSHILGVTIHEAEPANQPPPPARTDLPEIVVHYAIYDGIPLIEKWLTIQNASPKPVRVNRTIVETLKVAAAES